MKPECYLVFDTETTGKANFKLPPEHPSQPRLVQLAAILLDEQRAEVSSLNLRIIPSDFVIPPEATAIHGISTEQARRFGVPLLHGLLAFASLSRRATVCVAHNWDFDSFIMHGEACRMDVYLHVANFFCTMKAMTPICNLPGPYGGPKWPKLQEAYQFAFNEQFTGAHDALYDLRATARLFDWLMKRKGI